MPRSRAKTVAVAPTAMSEAERRRLPTGIVVASSCGALLSDGPLMGAGTPTSIMFGRMTVGRVELKLERLSESEEDRRLGLGLDAEIGSTGSSEADDGF